MTTHVADDETLNPTFAQIHRRSFSRRRLRDRVLDLTDRPLPSHSFRHADC